MTGGWRVRGLDEGRRGALALSISHQSVAGAPLLPRPVARAGGDENHPRGKVDDGSWEGTIYSRTGGGGGARWSDAKDSATRCRRL